MVTPFRYSDDGNHQIWVDAHQGGSFCRVNHLHRFFIGSEAVYPSIGGESWRRDSHTARSATSLGVQIVDLSDAGANRISTIAVVEDEVAGLGRYFFLEYEPEGGAMVPKTVKVYDSSYTTELTSATISSAWDPFVTLPAYAEQGMRIVNLGGSAGQTYLFYILPGPTSTVVNMVPLPDSGAAVSTDGPTQVDVVSFVVRDRIYVIPADSTSVFIYLGDTERSPTQRTTMIHYDVVSKEVLRTAVVKEGSTPFPRSNAVARGRIAEAEIPVHLILEPQSSWVEGAGRSADDYPSIDSENAPLFRQTTGNAWQMVSLHPNGSTEEDTVTIPGADIKPWMAATEATSQGGQVRTAAVPRMLARVSPPPESFSGLESTPDHDSSDVYALHTAVMLKYVGQNSGDLFVARVGNVDPTGYRGTFGNNRSTSNVFRDDPPPGLNDANRQNTTLLVPGSILIENARIAAPTSFQPFRTVGTVANRYDSWGLDDNSTFHGEPEASPTGATPIASTDHDPSTDALHGVQGDVFDEDLSVVVGWFVNGLFPSIPPP